MDKITKDQLFDKLGKPNLITKDQNGIYYRYYYYDGWTLPKEANLAHERLYIQFYFPSNEVYLKYVGEGHEY